MDGNKRIGVHVMLVVLELNDMTLSYKQKELSDIIMDVASGKADYDDFLNWVIEHL